MGAQKIQTFYLENQWISMDGWKEDKEKWIIVAKWYWRQINENKSYIGHNCFIFLKKIL